MYDVIVIGLGAMGSSTCLHLARRGVRVLGLEQFAIPHDRGSSHGLSRMIRLCYAEHPDYVPLLRRSYDLWRELEAASGRRLLHVTGGLYLGRGDGEFINGARRAATLHGLDHRLMSRDEIAREYPQFEVPDDFAGFFEPTAGLLLPEEVLATQAELALRAGAELHGHEPVLQWGPEGSGYVVTTSRGRYLASRVVVCAGAWVGRLIADLGVRLVATRQVLGWVWPKSPELFELGRCPVWAIEAPALEPPGLYYGFPMLPSAPGVKIARHVPGVPVSPDGATRDVTAEDEADFRPALRRFLPRADGPLLAVRACLYTSTPDSNFIIDRHPRLAGVAMGCGFSGHGFKFASVVGEVLADLSVRGATDHPIGFLGLARFGHGG